MAKLTLRLTDEARRGWDKECERHGVTLTALAEAIGLQMDEQGITSPQGEQVVAKARQLDIERRSRRHR